MAEILSDNLEPILKKVIVKWSLDSADAKKILDTYEKNKFGSLKYTKESLAWLRKILSIETREGFFGLPEIQALTKIVSTQVSSILSWPEKVAVTQTDQVVVPKWEGVDPKKTPAPHVVFQPVWSIPVGDVMLARENYQKCKDQIWPVISQVAPIVNMDPEKILAVCAQESRFVIDARSWKGAQGLMQVMPPTMKGILKFLRIWNTQNAGPEEKYYAQVREKANAKGVDINSLIDNVSSLGKNVAIGTIYLSYLIKTFWEEWGLRRYNSGPSINGSRENRKYAWWVKDWEKVIMATSKPDTTVS